MSIIEILLIILIVLIVAFILFWFFQGSSARISMRRPVESRVDEYLDRRFARLIDEFGVVRRPEVKRFKDERNAVFDADEAHIQDLKEFGTEFKQDLSSLEARLDALEKSFDQKKTGK